MSTLVEAPVAVRQPARPRGGGVPARRAIVRWAWRMFRREWRQQAIVLALLSVTVTAALFAVIAAYDMPPTSAATFGRADHRITLASTEPGAMTADVASLTARFDPVEVITHARLPIPGTAATVDLRNQAPGGRFGGPMLALRSGRYPGAVTEVAVTDAVATDLQLHVGDSLVLDDHHWTVVGIVENPADLDDEFVLASPDAAIVATSTVLLVGGHDAELHQRKGSIRSFAVSDPRVSAFTESFGGAEGGAAALGVLALDTVVLLLVSLVAAAAFVVVAQRRLRQLGMLAATGATDRHLRLVMIVHGAATGFAAVAIGNVAALVAWVVFAPRLAPLARHRLDRGVVPWWALALGTLLALATTTLAAWWPARVTARVPIVQALSGRPPRPRPAHRSALLAVVLLAIGAAALAFGIDKNGNAKPLAVIGGPIAVVLGVLLLCPIAVRLVATVADRLPVAARLAVRDLGRYQARAGAALAAISLGLGIAFTTIIVTTAAAPKPGTGNLSDRQVLLRLGGSDLVPEQTPDQLAAISAGIDQLASSLGGAVVHQLDAAVPADRSKAQGTIVDPFGQSGRRVAMLGHLVTHGVSVTGDDALYVASPDLLALVGVDPAKVAPTVEVITRATGDLVLVDDTTFKQDRSEPPAAVVMTVAGTGYTRVPNTFATETAMAAHGWARLRSGWFLEVRHALTAEQRAEVRAFAARSQLTLETRNSQDGYAVARDVATVAGVLLALGILAMTIGLIRSEAVRDLETLTATGATSATRRTISGVTAGAVALLGALLGLGGAYLALIAGYSDDLDPLRRVPALHLLLVVVGLPLIAAVAGWLLAGREPSTLVRHTLD